MENHSEFGIHNLCWIYALPKLVDRGLISLLCECTLLNVHWFGYYKSLCPTWIMNLCRLRSFSRISGDSTGWSITLICALSFALKIFKFSFCIPQPFHFFRANLNNTRIWADTIEFRSRSLK
jgi:hypothetical protein